MARSICRCLDPKAKRAAFGSLRVLPSGRHQARYVAPDGQSYKAPYTFDTHTDAEAWLAGVRTDITRGLWAPTKVAAPKLDFAGFAEEWWTTRELKPRTRDHYRKILDRFVLPVFGKLELAEITPTAVRAWYAALDTGPTYKAHAYGLLRTITRDAVTDGLLGATPCNIRGAGTAKRVIKIKPATLPELEAATKAMPDRLELIVLLAAWCAMRFGELSELRRKDIDVKNEVIRIRRGVTWVRGGAIIGLPKSGAGVRDVAIPPHLIPAVKAHLAKHTQWGPDGLLFPAASGANLTSTALYEAWWPARIAAGRPDLRFHDLRHTGAVLAAAAGGTLAELMGRLGHSTPAAAMRYQHAAEGRDKTIAARLSELARAGAE